MNAADTAIADNHNAMPGTARVAAGRLAEALHGDDFHGRENFPLPCAFLTDVEAFLADEPAKGQRERADGGGTER